MLYHADQLLSLVSSQCMGGLLPLYITAWSIFVISVCYGFMIFVINILHHSIMYHNIIRRQREVIIPLNSAQ